MCIVNYTIIDNFSLMWDKLVNELVYHKQNNIIFYVSTVGLMALKLFKVE